MAKQEIWKNGPVISEISCPEDDSYQSGGGDYKEGKFEFSMYKSGVMKQNKKQFNNYEKTVGAVQTEMETKKDDSDKFEMVEQEISFVQTGIKTGLAT